MLMGGNKNKNLSNILFRVQSDITETLEDEVKRVAKEKFEGMFKKINFIYANYNKLLKISLKRIVRMLLKMLSGYLMQR